MNWIEKVKESLKKAAFLHSSQHAESYDEIWERDSVIFQQTILKHAPVIDAEKIANQIYADWGSHYEEDNGEPNVKRIAQLITDNMEAQGIKVKK